MLLERIVNERTERCRNSTDFPFAWPCSEQGTIEESLDDRRQFTSSINVLFWGGAWHRVAVRVAQETVQVIAGRSIARRTSAIDIPGEKRIGALHPRNKNVVVVVVVVDNYDAVNGDCGEVANPACLRLRVHRAQCQGDWSLPVAERWGDSRGEGPKEETVIVNYGKLRGECVIRHSSEASFLGSRVPRCCEAFQGPATFGSRGPRAKQVVKSLETMSRCSSRSFPTTRNKSWKKKKK